MALRDQHLIMITQNNNWTTIELKDKLDEWIVATGSWKHTAESYNDEEIKFTSDNSKYLYWLWNPMRILNIGSKMNRASHKAGEEEIFQTFITLFGVERLANGKFRVASSDGVGSGILRYNVNPHFKAGAITWSVERYLR
ncbi:MAG: hypothetical protein WCK96_05285 [Methylococcales bacterium]